MNPPLLLRGVDLAAFAVALVARLRGGGVMVSAGGPATFVQAIDRLTPRSRTPLYWAARLTLLNRAEDIPAFDATFETVFSDAVFTADPVGLERLRYRPDAGADTGNPAASGGHLDGDGRGLPWTTRAATIVDRADTSLVIPETLPSRLIARADESFDRFDDEDLRLLGDWLEHAVQRWPRRRSLRREHARDGSRINLRDTMKRSRRTGYEMVVLARTRPQWRPRRLVLACDVSRSMQPYAAVYLHLMRAAALRRDGIRPEVFAFSTSLTRLTAVLAHRSAEAALHKANAAVTDRYGGTHLGRSIAGLLAAPHGNALRGALVIIASDGWDSDPPELLQHALARVRRRAARVIWLNPRAAQPNFQPLAGSMAAALPYCDALLPGHSLAGLRDVFRALDE